MLNIVFENEQEVKAKEGRYLIGLLNGTIYEADSFKEMVAAICGSDYQDCEAAETAKIMRIKAAKQIALSVMAAEDFDAALEAGISGEEQSEDWEKIIIFDENIGEIPYSFTEAKKADEFQRAQELIRVESDETFILSLEKCFLIAVFEKDNNGEYRRLRQNRDLEKEIGACLESFQKG